MNDLRQTQLTLDGIAQAHALNAEGHKSNRKLMRDSKEWKKGDEFHKQYTKQDALRRAAERAARELDFYLNLRDELSNRATN